MVLLYWGGDHFDRPLPCLYLHSRHWVVGEHIFVAVFDDATDLPVIDDATDLLIYLYLQILLYTFQEGPAYFL